jgi:hypothetical protein
MVKRLALPKNNRQGLFPLSIFLGKGKLFCKKYYGIIFSALGDGENKFIRLESGSSIDNW